MSKIIHIIHIRFQNIITSYHISYDSYDYMEKNFRNRRN